MKYTLFVYGSLKRGKPLHFYLSRAQFLGVGVTEERYPLILAEEGWYPYLLDFPGKGYRVTGELYSIDYPTLKLIDQVEEYPKYYIRKKIYIEMEKPAPNSSLKKGEKVEALCYFKRTPIQFSLSHCLFQF
ncbi:MAG: gamma-glutamylcyclotransferase family protein [Campylobacterales bacterium]